MGQAFLCQPEGYRLARLVELWTLKESYVKAVGLGWRIPPDSFTVSGERVERTVGLPVSALSARPRLWGRRLCPRGQLSKLYRSGGLWALCDFVWSSLREAGRASVGPKLAALVGTSLMSASTNHQIDSR